MTKIIKKQLEDINEAGDMHNIDCCCNKEGGCDVDVELLDCCDNMRFIKKQVLTAQKEGYKEAKKRYD